MRRNHHINNAGAYTVETRKRCVAFHEAGHAAAIFLNNRKREIPPHLFSLRFNIAGATANTDFKTAYEDYIACIEGGRLLQALPSTLEGMQHPPMETGHDWIQTADDLLNAFEADVINLLAGPLSEAKYIAETDGEIFTHRLVDPPALLNYGGVFDLALVDDYLQSFSTALDKRAQKLSQLHQVAFNFINDYHNWRAVSKLARYILATSKDTICYEEVAAIVGGV